MTFLCLGIALALTCFLAFVSYVQLLYLESLRLIRREVPALEFFREKLVDQIGLEPEHGSLSFSLVKHVSLFLIGLFYLCALVRPGVPHWQSVLEAIATAFVAMLLSTYLVPLFLHRRTKGLWMSGALPLIKLVAKGATPLAALIRLFQSLLDLDKDVRGEPVPADATEHIEALITAGAEEGILEEEDRKLIHSVVAFGDKSVREVMTPRPDIVAISADKSLEDLRQLVIHEQYSRIPVYQESIDNVLGFVHVRDMFELDPEDRQAK
ncbi:MAG: CBS domain-containing protein, partial [Acidobacteriaceae bacterium]|nr:CBS domain-containing protein [Acidobacteriaceae bacterium]